MIKIFIDPGHGGKDPGAVGNGIQEKNINLAVALKIGEILLRHNLDVHYSRTSDLFVDLTERASMANKSKASIFISIHCNSFGNPSAQGVETFYFASSSKGKALAEHIQKSFIDNKVYTRNRGVKTANFTVIAKTTMPAVLVEMGFITNTQDANILKNRQEELALSVAKGILKHLNIEYIDSRDIVRIDFQGKRIDARGFIKDDVNYVQVREVFEKLGYIVDWDSKSKLVIIR